MLVLAIGIVAVTLVWWLFVKREEPVSPVVRYVASAAGIVCLGLVTTLRGGPLAGLVVVAAGSVALWWSLGGRGGGGGGDDGPGPPPDPDPEPGPAERVDLPASRLDDTAFDRARAEWERELPKRG